MWLWRKGEDYTIGAMSQLLVQAISEVRGGTHRKLSFHPNSDPPIACPDHPSDCCEAFLMMSKMIIIKDAAAPGTLVFGTPAGTIPVVNIDITAPIVSKGTIN